MRVLGELLPLLQRYLLERTFGIWVESKEKFGIEIIFEMFQDERFDLVMAVVKINGRKKRLERIREQFGFKKILEIVPEIFADQKDILELDGQRDTAQDLLRNQDRTELRKHALIRLREFLEKFLADHLV